MNKTLMVARHEFLETVMTRAFLIGAVIMPLAMVGLIFGMEKLMKAGQSESLPLRKIAVTDETGGDVLKALQDQVAAHNAGDAKRPIELVTSDETPEQWREKVKRAELHAHLRVPAGALTKGEPAEYAISASRLEELKKIRTMVNEALAVVRFAKHDPPIDRAMIAALQMPVDLNQIDVRTGEKSAGRELPRFLMPFVFMFLLWTATFGIAQGLLTSVIDEKSTRVIETLLSAVSPMQLMTGKILGLVGVGFLLVCVWLTCGYFGLRTYNMSGLLTGDKVFYFALYFLPAFLLYAAILAAIGSAFNTLKEAQSMVAPVTLLTITPMMLWAALTEYPSSVLAVSLSYIPPITPFAMMLRLCADPNIPLWQIISTLALLWASAIFMIWVAAKVFRIGILMYGKPPSPREILKWLAQS